MATRVTTIRLAALIALVAMGSLAGLASACDGHSKTASAAGACCASKAQTTACATSAAKPASKSTAYVALPSASAPVATTAFPSLPVFTQQAPIVAGLWAFIDPETGMLTGPSSDFTVPDDVARRFTTPVELTPVTMPNGAVMIDLQGTMQDYYVLTIDPLGRRGIRCVQDARKAQAPAAPIVLPIAER
jgi:hypothetical protein